MWFGRRGLLGQLGKRVLKVYDHAGHFLGSRVLAIQFRRDGERFAQIVPGLGRIIRHLAQRIETPEKLHLNLGSAVMPINDVLKQPYHLPDRIGSIRWVAAPIESNAALVECVRRIQLRINVFGGGLHQLLANCQALLIGRKRRGDLSDTLKGVAGLVESLRLRELQVADLFGRSCRFLLPDLIAGFACFEILASVELGVEFDKSICRIALCAIAAPSLSYPPARST